MIRLIYVFVFLIPFESLFIIEESFTGVKLVGWGIFAGWLINKLVNKESFKFFKGFQLATLYVSWAALSFIWADDNTLVIERLPTLLQLLGIYYILVDSLRTSKELSNTIWFYTAGCIVAAIIAVLPFYQRIDPLLYRATLGDTGPNGLALSVIPVIWWLGFNLKNARATSYKWYFFVCSLFPIIALLIFAASRGAMFALIAPLLIMFRHMDKRTIIIAGFVGILVLGIVVGAEEVTSPLVGRFDLNWDQMFHVDKGAGRFDIWTVGWRAYWDNPILGCGLDNFTIAFDKFLQFAKYVGYGRGSHNIYLGTAVELGIIGLGFFLAFYGFILRQTFILYKLRLNMLSNDAILVSNLLFGLVSLSVGGFSLDILYTKYFWLFLALGEAGSLRFVEFRLEKPALNQCFAPDRRERHA